MVDENKTPEQKEQERKDEEVKQVNRVIRGVNDTFEKEYEFKELGLKFKIKLTYPSMADNAQVQSILEAFFNGTASLVPNGAMLNAYTMMAVITQQQRKYENLNQPDKIHIPEFLRDIEEVYNPSVLVAIHRDFQEWMQQFQF